MHLMYVCIVSRVFNIFRSLRPQGKSKNLETTCIYILFYIHAECINPLLSNIKTLILHAMKLYRLLIN